MTLQTFSSLRSNENLERVTQAAKELDILDPLLPWQRKMSIRYEIGNDLLIIQIILLNASILKQLTSLLLVSQRGLISQGLLCIVMFKICL